MCGIAGFLATREAKFAPGAALAAMSDAITHRGPDSHGTWLDDSNGIGLAHRRLAILDLTPTGHQPMVSPSGRFVMIYNGEIYNHLEMRDAIEAKESFGQWRGHSDTETLLAAIEAWGIRASLARSVGMFALAVWDRAARTLYLARDRLGEKPLYLAELNFGYIFASELRSLNAHPSFDPEIDPASVRLMIKHGFVPGGFSIYRRVRKVEPGCVLVIEADACSPVNRPFWDRRGAFLRGRSTPFRGAPADAVGELDTICARAVSGQMISDVPLGAFLSGGVDSSTIVALMQAHSSRPVRTFSIGVHDDSYDEAQYARAIARHLGTDHTELYLDPGQILDTVPRLASVYDEPFADSSQIPTLLVSELAKKEVQVALSGDGGDELFAGYNRHAIISSLWPRLSRIPPALRMVLGRVLAAVPPAVWSRIDSLTGKRSGLAQLDEKMAKAAAVLGAETLADLYRGLLTRQGDPSSRLVIGSEDHDFDLADPAYVGGSLNDVERVMVWDTIGYLTDDILTKVDRAAMSVSLETRVPFLDHRIVEFAWSLPMQFKIREGQSKWVLRQLLFKYVPRSLIDRPKMGFAVPVAEWLRGPLRDWAQDLFDRYAGSDGNLLDSALVKRLWAVHLQGRADRSLILWSVLMFYGWMDHQRAGYTERRRNFPGPSTAMAAERSR